MFMKDPDAQFRTIMSSDCATGKCDNLPKAGCTRIQRFSNPALTYESKSIGLSNANNARQLNEQRFNVCNYYTCGPLSSPAPTPSPTVSLAPTYTQFVGGTCNLDAGGQGSWAKFDILTDDYGEETSWELRDETNSLVAFHEIRSYRDNDFHTRFICVPSGPLTFAINDTYGDGTFHFLSFCLVGLPTAATSVSASP